MPTLPHAYKAPHRYWTGLLLVVRIFLLISFATFQSFNTWSSINLLTTVLLSFALIGLFSLARGVYESLLNNFLEITFLCNLGMTSAAVLFDKRHTNIAVIISTTVAFTVFVFIVLYHAVRRLLLTKCGSNCKELMLTKRERGDISNMNVSQGGLVLGSEIRASEASTIELKEPLLEDETY